MVEQLQEELYDRARWEQQYSQGDWDYLKSEQIPRYGVLCSYMKHLGQPISLLDVGCGEGLILRFCDRDWLVNYTGLDISQTALDRIKTLLPTDRLICSPLEEFSTDQRFDVILFNEVLYYMSDPKSHLKKFRNYLKPGGKILISMLEMPGWRSRTARNARSIWQFIEKCKWRKIDDVLIKDVQHRKSWRVALIQP